MRSQSIFAALLVAALLTACGGGSTDKANDELTFTADDVAHFRELANEAANELPGSGSGSSGTMLDFDSAELKAPQGETVIDLSMVPMYDTLRGQSENGEDLYRVTNDFLNLRDAPGVRATLIDQLNQGDNMVVLDFPNAAWAHVKLPDGREGYVSLSHIAKLVSEENLDAERAKFDGKYFVDFGFLNVRNAPDTNAEQIGELPGQLILEPLTVDDVWARILYEGQEAYVASEYLTPFKPSFLVRQDRYQVPVVRYDLSDNGALTQLAQHIDALQGEDYNFITFTDFYDHLLAQEQRDVRLPPRSVMIALVNPNGTTLDEASDILRTSGVTGTFFVKTSLLNAENGISDSQLKTMLANGFDVQSAAHSGDDLRSLTNAQLQLELEQSRSLLEAATGQTVVAVAYPAGGVNERVTEKAAAAGYLFGLSNQTGVSFLRSQFLELPTVSVTAETTADSLTGELQVE